MSWLLLTLLGVLIFSSTGLWHRILMRDADSDPVAHTIVFFSLGGSLSLVLAVATQGFDYRVTPTRLALFVPLTVFSAIGPVMLFKSFQSLGASENAILQSTQKLWTVTGAFVFLKEPFTLNKLAGTLVVVAGIVIVFAREGRFELNRAAALVIAATFFYAAADLISFYIVRDLDPLSFLVWVYWLPVLALVAIRPSSLRRISFYFRWSYAASVVMSRQVV